MNDEEQARDGGTTVDGGFGRPESQPGAALDRGWAGDETRTIHVRLTSDEYWELRQRAHAASLRPWDLARHWIIAQLDRPHADGDGGDAGEVETLAAMLLEQRRVVDHLAYRLDRLERAVTPAAHEYGYNAFAGSRTVPGATAPPAHFPHPKLHEEILQVLHESGVPMTSEQISEAVTRRGRYRARSGHAVSAAAISGRIANPRYRALFRREGRSIMPAVSQLTES